MLELYLVQPLSISRFHLDKKTFSKWQDRQYYLYRSLPVGLKMIAFVWNNRSSSPETGKENKRNQSQEEVGDIYLKKKKKKKKRREREREKKKKRENGISEKAKSNS